MTNNRLEKFTIDCPGSYWHGTKVEAVVTSCKWVTAYPANGDEPFNVSKSFLVPGWATSVNDEVAELKEEVSTLHKHVTHLLLEHEKLRLRAEEVRSALATPTASEQSKIAPAPVPSEARRAKSHTSPAITSGNCDRRNSDTATMNRVLSGSSAPKVP